MLLVKWVEKAYNKIHWSGNSFSLKLLTMKPILLEIPEKFETERLIISAYQVGDGKDLYQLFQSNIQHLQEEVSDVHSTTSAEDAEAYVREKQIDWLARKRLVPKVLEKSTGRMIGQLWIEPRWERMTFEIGYFLEADSQGKGYITEAVNHMIDFLFTQLNANRLEIHTKATNHKSIAVAERCGFLKEAQLRERSRTNSGEKVDILIFGLLKSEYLPQAGR